MTAAWTALSIAGSLVHFEQASFHQECGGGRFGRVWEGVREICPGPLPDAAEAAAPHWGDPESNHLGQRFFGAVRNTLKSFCPYMSR
jgi:hypothetical protein